MFHCGMLTMSVAMAGASKRSRRLTLRRSMLSQHSACTPLRNAERSLGIFYTGTAEFRTQQSFICSFSQK